MKWRRIIRIYRGTGLLRENSRSTICAHCALVGLFIKDPEAFSATNHANLRLYSAMLGLNPIDQDRLPVSREFARQNSRFVRDPSKFKSV